MKAHARLSRPERRQAFLRAAAELFFEQGYAKTSLDAVIQRAGGSKRDLYEEFKGKEEVLGALLQELAERIVVVLTPPKNQSEDIRVLLLQFAKAALHTISSPLMLGIAQSAIAASGASPPLREMFFQSGPGKSEEHLIKALERAKAREEIHIDDCALAADIFMGMLRGNSYLKAMIHYSTPLSAEAQDRYAEAVVSIFMDGVEKKSPLFCGLPPAK